MEKDRWRLLSHARNTDHDGYQVFCEQGGTFGTVFLVPGDQSEQTLKVQVGEVMSDGDKIALEIQTDSTATSAVPPIAFRVPGDDRGLRLFFPDTDVVSGQTDSVARQTAISWRASEGDALWFEANEGDWRRGGRITPNQDDVELEYWWQCGQEGMELGSPVFAIDLADTVFEDRKGDRTWALTSEGWGKVGPKAAPADSGIGAIAAKSSDGEKIVCMAWPRAVGVVAEHGKRIGVALRSVRFPPNRRYHVRGKIYLVEGDLQVLGDRIRREMDLFSR
jgi:hypothetical protein